MNEKPTALHLADQLQSAYPHIYSGLAPAAAQELRRLHLFDTAYREWLVKTDWVQKTAHPCELGLHRADVIKARYDALVEALTLVLSCARMAGPVGTTAYLISDARMEAALDALGKATGQPHLTKTTGDAA